VYVFLQFEHVGRFALLTAFLLTGGKSIRKEPGPSHRASTQHWHGSVRLFVAKAQDNGRDFTEMKTACP
jgi:hypothetical protein